MAFLAGSGTIRPRLGVARAERSKIGKIRISCTGRDGYESVNLTMISSLGEISRELIVAERGGVDRIVFSAPDGSSYVLKAQRRGRGENRGRRLLLTVFLGPDERNTYGKAKIFLDPRS